MSAPLRHAICQGALVAVLAAAPALAEGGPKPEEVSAFLAAVKAGGCTLDAGNQAAVLKAAGLTEDEAALVVQRLEDEGKLLSRPGPVLTLPPEVCQ